MFCTDSFKSERRSRALPLIKCGLLLSILLLSSNLFAASSEVEAGSIEKTVLIGTGDWPPYVDQQSPDAGILARMITAIFAKAGYQTKFVFYPWDRNVYLLRKGTIDAVMPYVCSPERQEFSLCSDPIAESNIVLFHHKDKAFDWKQFSDIEPYLIAVTQGYFYSDDFSRAREEGRLTLEQSSVEYRGMQLILAKRADLFPQDQAVGQSLLKKNFTTQDQAQITSHPKPLAANLLGLLFGKDERGQELRKAFNAELAVMRKNGELQRMQKALESGMADSWKPAEK
jgi:polar amino acid transport system substrate-binding protein